MLDRQRPGIVLLSPQDHMRTPSGMEKACPD